MIVVAVFFFQAEDGIRDLVRSRGLGDVYKRQTERFSVSLLFGEDEKDINNNKEIVQKIYNSGYVFPQAPKKPELTIAQEDGNVCLLYTSDAADERSSVDLGGRRIIKKKQKRKKKERRRREINTDR